MIFWKSALSLFKVIKGPQHSRVVSVSGKRKLCMFLDT